MDTFNFPMHIVKTQYPESGDSMTLGNSYEFTAKPKAPDQRLFILTFPAMRFFVNSDGSYDTTSSPTLNYRLLQLFYEAHRKWATFVYPHPSLGNINVRFARPLADPDPIPGGGGALGQFELQFREQFT